MFSFSTVGKATVFCSVFIVFGLSKKFVTEDDDRNINPITDSDSEFTNKNSGSLLPTVAIANSYIDLATSSQTTATKSQTTSEKIRDNTWFNVNDIKDGLQKVWGNVDDIQHLDQNPAIKKIPNLHGYVLPHAGTAYTKFIYAHTLRFRPTKTVQNIIIVYLPANEKPNIDGKLFHEFYVPRETLKVHFGNEVNYIGWNMMSEKHWYIDGESGVDGNGVGNGENVKLSDGGEKTNEILTKLSPDNTLFILSADMSHFKPLQEAVPMENCAAQVLMHTPAWLEDLKSANAMETKYPCLKAVDDMRSFKFLYKELLPKVFGSSDSENKVNDLTLQWIGRTRSTEHEGQERPGVGYLSFLLRDRAGYNGKTFEELKKMGKEGNSSGSGGEGGSFVQGSESVTTVSENSDQDQQVDIKQLQDRTIIPAQPTRHTTAHESTMQAHLELSMKTNHRNKQPDGFFVTAYDDNMTHRECLGNVKEWSVEKEGELLKEVMEKARTTSRLTGGDIPKSGAKVEHFTITYLFKESGESNNEFIRGWHAMSHGGALYLPDVFLENTFDNGKWIEKSDRLWPEWREFDVKGTFHHLEEKAAGNGFLEIMLEKDGRGSWSASSSDGGASNVSRSRPREEQMVLGLDGRGEVGQFVEGEGGADRGGAVAYHSGSKSSFIENKDDSMQLFYAEVVHV